MIVWTTEISFWCKTYGNNYFTMLLVPNVWHLVWLNRKKCVRQNLSQLGFGFLWMSVEKQSRIGICSFSRVFILFNKNTLLSLRCVCCRFWKFYQWRLSEHCTIFWSRKETFWGGEIFLDVWSIWTGQYLKDNPVKVKCL